MNILVCPDKFKGTLAAQQAGEAIVHTIRRHRSTAEVRLLPLADGGEGTVDCFLAQGATRVECRVHDPLMRSVVARYAFQEDRRTACVEMAEASGLMRLQPSEYNPLRTTSLGTGELIRDAVTRGARKIILGIGGSATNDGGTGMMTALGTSFRDKSGTAVFPCGGSLLRMLEVDQLNRMAELQETTIVALCDVTNPFFGEQGAACIYAPQKGASEDDVRILDAGLRHLASLIQKSGGIDLQQVPGAGAGGGLAGGAVAWLGAQLRSGIDVIMEQADFDQALRWADVVITGEGKVDRQSVSGKVVDGVIRHAKSAGKGTVVVCGVAEPGAGWPGVPVFAMVDFAGPARSLDTPVDVLEELVERVVLPELDLH